MGTIKKLAKKSQGFTIIEVMIVLAIAGLIISIVFLAVPALQRTQRDTRRKNDMNRFFASLETYAGNNGGTYPNTSAAMSTFVTTYLTANSAAWADPSGGAYNVTTNFRTTGALAPPTNTTNGRISVGTGTAAGGVGYICNATGTAATQTGAGARNVAITYLLENGGTKCQSNQ